MDLPPCLVPSGAPREHLFLFPVCHFTRKCWLLGEKKCFVFSDLIFCPPPFALGVWPLCFGFCLTPGFGVQCIAGMCVQQFQITQTMQTPGFVFNSYLSLCHGLSRGKTCSILPGKDSAALFCYLGAFSYCLADISSIFPLFLCACGAGDEVRSSQKDCQAGKQPQ